MALARMNASLVLACRNRVTAEATVTELKQATGDQSIDLIDLDLARCGTL